jgi:Tfp pilus assembly protein PilO
MLKQILQGSATLAAAGIAGYFWLVRAPLEQLEQAKAQQFELQREYVERQKYRINLPLLRAQIPVMKGLDAAAKIVLPDFDGLAAGPKDLEDTIRAAAREKQLKSRLEFSTTDWSAKEFYYFRPFSVQVSGEFRQVVEFLQLVSTGWPQLRTIRTATLRPVAGRDEVALSLEALAFRYVTEEQVATGLKAKNQPSTGRPQ